MVSALLFLVGFHLVDSVALIVLGGVVFVLGIVYLCWEMIIWEHNRKKSIRLRDDALKTILKNINNRIRKKGGKPWVYGEYGTYIALIPKYYKSK